MTLRKITAAGAALALAASPAVYASANARTAAPAQGENELAGGALYGVLAIAIVAAFTVITVSAEDDDDTPVSA